MIDMSYFHLCLRVLQLSPNVLIHVNVNKSIEIILSRQQSLLLANLERDCGNHGELTKVILHRRTITN